MRRGGKPAIRRTKVYYGKQRPALRCQFAHPTPDPLKIVLKQYEKIKNLNRLIYSVLIILVTIIYSLKNL